jgi:hypothetical protein
MGAATEAMVELLFGTDCKRRSLFRVKGATGMIFPPHLFQWYPAIDNLHDIDPGQEFINKMLGNSTCHTYMLCIHAQTVS